MLFVRRKYKTRLLLVFISFLWGILKRIWLKRHYLLSSLFSIFKKLLARLLLMVVMGIWSTLKVVRVWKLNSELRRRSGRIVIFIRIWLSLLKIVKLFCRFLMQKHTFLKENVAFQCRNWEERNKNKRLWN